MREWPREREIQLPRTGARSDEPGSESEAEETGAASVIVNAEQQVFSDE
jgi:hypothetical protein